MKQGNDVLEEKEDYCMDDTTLIEYYCSDEESMMIEYDCPHGCEDGACQEKECEEDFWCPDYSDVPAGCSVAQKEYDEDGCLIDCPEIVCREHNTGGERYCGDGVVHTGEECDDGNNRTGDGCDNNCYIE